MTNLVMDFSVIGFMLTIILSFFSAAKSEVKIISPSSPVAVFYTNDTDCVLTCSSSSDDVKWEFPHLAFAELFEVPETFYFESPSVTVYL